MYQLIILYRRHHKQCKVCAACAVAFQDRVVPSRVVYHPLPTKFSGCSNDADY